MYNWNIFQYVKAGIIIDCVNSYISMYFEFTEESDTKQ